MTRKVPLICTGHSRPVHDFSYSPQTEDGFFLASASLDGKPMLRNGQTGDWIGTFEGHKGAAWAVHINQTATQVVTGSADYTAKVWNALSGEEVQSFVHTRIVKSVHFSQDGKKVLTGGQDKILRIFDLDKPEAEPLKLEGHTDTIKNGLWTPTPNTIVSGGGEGVMRVWDTRSLKQTQECNIGAPITSMELSLDGKHATITAGKEISFWNVHSLEKIKSYTLETELHSGSLSPDQATFVVGGIDFWAHVHDFATGKELEVHKGHHGPIHCIRFAPDGATFASGGEDGTIRLWQSGEPRTYGLWAEHKPEE